ncbi:MAG TPA: phospholipase D-like domain-containing protein [Flavisolibacter sp.]|jgi:phosphatidylserine/phosphatidylglycerophosphate/cardiolipin synthase-like enzyme|nr:phospholipase D-like domain-containing protein [Flavisolibacter sp.]
MPLLVTTGLQPEALDALSPMLIEMVGRNCALTEYTPLDTIPTFRIRGEFIAYASPDSTYAVTRRLIDAAKESIVIGIYDFTAAYMKELLLNAMQRGVTVSLMLDIDSKDEESVFKELEKFGATTVPAPSCASKAISYFPSSHEKVIVIDGTWSLVQSGNYSTNSIPFNEEDGGDKNHFKKGNRDMGVAIKSKPLAAFFTGVLESDMQLQLDAMEPEALRRDSGQTFPELVELVPQALPVKLFSSKSFKPETAIAVTPILTPDNYMDLIPALLARARKSIFIENQYIRSKGTEVMKLLDAIRTAMDNNPELDVRIILGKLFSAADVTKEKANVANLKKEYGLKLGDNIRYIDTTRFVHCHNKLIVVDNKEVLISSQNWSDTGVGTNREAGVLMDFPQIARYYAGIFESDWSTAFTKVPNVGRATVTPEALAKGNYMAVSPADYQEV